MKSEQMKGGEDSKNLIPIFKKDSSDADNEILLGGTKKGSTPPKSDNISAEEKKVDLIIDDDAEEVKNWFSLLDKDETKLKPLDIKDLRPLYPVKKDRSDKKSVIASLYRSFDTRYLVIMKGHLISLEV